MKIKFELKLSSAIISTAILIYSSYALSLTINENFTGSSTENVWLTPNTGGGTTDNVACLTAGSGSKNGSPPACNDVKEQVGQGALRLTPALNQRAGGILSSFTFPSNEGLQVSFTTYTFGTTGDIDGKGADGISFFLTDGITQPSFGAKGGSLGYSCTNNTDGIPNGKKGQGIIGGYLGVGIDEFGNFLSSRDNTNSGLGTGQYPNYIGIRGAGSINNVTYPGQNIDQLCAHPGSLPDYKRLGSARLNSPIGNNSARTRSQATPINYKLKIYPDPNTNQIKLSLWYSYNGGNYQSVMVDKDISSNGPLPDSFRFGFAASTGGANNNHEITCFKAAPASKSENSSPISLPDGKYKSGAQIYTTVYNEANWWASLRSNNIVSSAQVPVAVDPMANWDASCVLTGGSCESMHGQSIAAEAPISRQIITYSRKIASGIPFLWSSLADDQKVALSIDGNGNSRLDYLRGDRSNEQNRATGRGIFRKRTSVLGDIINSSPAWVGPPSVYASNEWIDLLNPTAAMPEKGTTAQSYADFKATYNARLNVVYVGSNDGLLHGFQTGVFDAATGSQFDKTASQKLNDGKEVIAFMPEDVLKRIHSSISGLDYSGINYGHNYFNDSTPGTGDLFYNGKWHTWLVSGLGLGGAGIYALDITNPNTFTQGNAKDIVIGEWSHKDNDSLWEHLGDTFGTPEIRRFHNGKWGAVFGNGWCGTNDVTNGNCKASSTGKAGIYIMLVDSSGKITFQFIATAAGTSGSPDGIAYVTPADLDGDGIIDYIYAGDIKGNIWRFDVTSQDNSAWNNSPIKLFSSSASQPITSKIMVSAVSDPVTGKVRVMINFGTGQKISGYLGNADSYSTSTQALYGIWDSNLADWNSKNSTQYEASSISHSTSISDLVLQTTTGNKLSNNVVCWAGSTVCNGNGANVKYGWYMNLASNEQAIYNPIIGDNAVFINTYVPGVDQIVTCDATSSSGFTYAFDPATGNGIPGFFSGKSKDVYGERLSLNAVGSPSIVLVDGKSYLVSTNSKGVTTFTLLHNFIKDRNSKRISWVQLR